MLEEEWVPVRDFPRYLVSNLGRVYDCNTNTLVKFIISPWGYFQVSLKNENGYKTKTVHRIVAERFVAGEDFELEVNHIDGDKTNNYDFNLEWVTKRENNMHAISSGLRTPRHTVVQIRETGQKFNSVKECAEALGTYPTVISALTNGRLHSYKGIHVDHAN